MQSNQTIARIQAGMRVAGVDLAAFGPGTNMFYCLGFAPHADERLCLLLVGQAAVCVVAPGLNLDEMAAHARMQYFAWDDAQGPQEALGQALAILGPVDVLAVDSALPSASLLQLQAQAKPRAIQTADNLLYPLRICKSAAEIEALALAAAQADRAMQAAIRACRPGVSEAEVAWETEAAFRKDGAEMVCFTLIASGPNAAFPHHHSGERQLQAGEAVLIDIGASLHGYKSDITRMVHLGQPDEEFLRAYQAVYAANQQASAAVRPGVTAAEIDRAARQSLESAGYGPYFTHRTGHGLGLDGHEPPWIMAGESSRLQEGMVFSIEPGVYLPGHFGIRVEDIIVVTGSGARCLTSSDHALVIKD